MKANQEKTIKLECGEVTIKPLKVKQVLKLNASLPKDVSTSLTDTSDMDIASTSHMISIVMDFIEDKNVVTPHIKSDDDSYYLDTENNCELSFDDTTAIVSAVFELSYGDNSKKAEREAN